MIAIACHKCSSCISSPCRFRSNGIESRWRCNFISVLCTEGRDTILIFSRTCYRTGPTNSSIGSVVCCAPAKQQRRAAPSCCYVQGCPALMIARVRASVKSKEHTRHCFMLTCLLFPTFAWSPVMYLMAVATTLRTTIGARSTMHGNLHHVMIASLEKEQTVRTGVRKLCSAV